MATRGEKVIKFIETFCCAPEGMHVGERIVLDESQKRFILEVYDNPHSTRKAILSMARKNGKTALIACLVLAHLVGPESKQNSHIHSGAQSREQAAVVFDLAAKMVRMNSRLGQVVRIVPSTKRLIGLPMNVEYRALSAEGKTAHGGSPIVAILDEVGQVRGPHDEFIEAVVTSQGAYDNPLLLVISTQAPGDEDLLSVWIDDALKGDDPHTVCHLYTAPDGCKVDDPAAWEAANPAINSFRSREDIKTKAEEAKRMPSFANTFRNLYLNQRVSAQSPFITRDSWKSCGDEPLPLTDCEEVFAALDLSGRTDLTCFLLLGKHDDTYHAHPFFFTPEKGLFDRSARDRAPYPTWVDQGYIETTPGATVDYEFVAAAIARLVQGINLVGISYDRWRMDVLKKEFERIGLELPLVEWGQGFKDMAPALDAAEAMILNGRLNHGNHPVLTMCAANAKVVKNPAGDRKLERLRNAARIDGMVALAMAAGLAARSELQLGGFDDFLSNPIRL